MKLFKMIATALCLIASQTFVFCQTMPDKKWDVGLKGGFDYSMFQRPTFKESVQSGAFKLNSSVSTIGGRCAAKLE
jgi:hypothetical protein